ncbi:NAD(P)-dependent alcohol dehydrogenase [Alteromonas lipolytica]|uniref:Zn-dependent alcohol dehydrogenase n=1 Tax=Alteromonas lipolytica TaxID=1856405 RepID=A0A1E8FET6_9ALTE|nr:NAD(P)-dependent alcohol dehydrogenase [Alteromonas lipolytica]OFI33993.1 Zn-dependent alcohol dehydrogenase [Alteromonas lipolytica]GGF66489.1 arabinose dehydrogenase [Alteromonas lipolytica]
MCEKHQHQSAAIADNHEGHDASRRKFIHATSAVGAGVMLSGLVPSLATAAPLAPKPGENIKSKGYAAFDDSGFLKPWEFERRPVGDDDILIDIKFASICHSDIHQMKGHWAPQQYPQVPGHEIVGVVAAVGKNVTKFKVGDRAGVGCMVDGCADCDTSTSRGEQYSPQTKFTYGHPDDRSPTGITQGGYATNIVVRDHFAVHIPEAISFEEAAPLLCAGVTTYSPLLKFNLKKGDKVGVAGIGGLGHLAVKLAVSKGAEVYAFTTSPGKVADIKAFGAKEVIVVDSPAALNAYRGQLDYMINTLPVAYDVAAYASVVKPFGTYTQVGMPNGFTVSVNALALSASQVNFNASLIGDMKETQDIVDYCVKHDIRPEIQVIPASDVNKAWESVIKKTARYRYVIDSSTI